MPFHCYSLSYFIILLYGKLTVQPMKNILSRQNFHFNVLLLLLRALELQHTLQSWHNLKSLAENLSNTQTSVRDRLTKILDFIMETQSCLWQAYTLELCLCCTNPLIYYYTCVFRINLIITFFPQSTGIQQNLPITSQVTHCQPVYILWKAIPLWKASLIRLCG